MFKIHCGILRHESRSEQSQQANRIRHQSPVSLLSRKPPHTLSMWRRRRSSNKPNPDSGSLVLSNASYDSVTGSNTADLPQQSAHNEVEFTSDPNPVTQEHDIGDISNGCVIFTNVELATNQSSETAL